MVSQKVIGSTVFVISENDLLAANPEAEDQQTIAYVDDSNEQAAAGTHKELLFIMQVRENNVTEWLSNNQTVIAPCRT